MFASSYLVIFPGLFVTHFVRAGHNDVSPVGDEMLDDLTLPVSQLLQRVGGMQYYVPAHPRGTHSIVAARERTLMSGPGTEGGRTLLSGTE